VLVCLVHRPISGIRNPIRVMLKGSPEVRHHAIKVVDGFRVRLVWSAEEHRA
jgi:hypothetical protein